MFSLGKTPYFEGLGCPGCSKWAPSGAHGRHLGLKVEPLGTLRYGRIFECLFGGFRLRAPGAGGGPGGPEAETPETTVKAGAASPYKKEGLEPGWLAGCWLLSWQAWLAGWLGWLAGWLAGLAG